VRLSDAALELGESTGIRFSQLFRLFVLKNRNGLFSFHLNPFPVHLLMVGPYCSCEMITEIGCCRFPPPPPPLLLLLQQQQLNQPVQHLLLLLLLLMLQLLPDDTSTKITDSPTKLPAPRTLPCRTSPNTLPRHPRPPPAPQAQRRLMQAHRCGSAGCSL
jgi:hypothetical protein